MSPVKPSGDSLDRSDGEVSHPPRFPIACGALGRFDRASAARIAEALGNGLSIVHQDDESILFCDRPPIRWRHRTRLGLCWSEGIPRDARITSWQEAARSLAACGFLLGDDPPLLHSSVGGLAPVYYRQVGDATYFASRIDPLVAAFDERLSIDWEAWASIFLLTAPIGDRTPFAEIRRLAPFSLLGHRPGTGSHINEHEWPWAQAGPGGQASPEAVVHELRALIGSLPEGPVICPLSGGWDSRLLLALLSERANLPLSALTLRRHHGGHDEEEYARAVAAALSVPLREVGAPDSTPWSETTEVAARTDYQTTHHDWFMPLARGVRGQGGLVADGLCGDVLLAAFRIREEMLDSRSWDEGIRLLWNDISNWPFATEVLSGRLAAAFSTLAWRQWEQQATPLSEHPACLSLTLYRTRTVRAVALAPTSVLGTDADVRTPFTDDRVASAALMLPMRSKVRDEAYRRLFELVNPTVGSLPSTHDPRPQRGPAPGSPEPTGDTVGGYRRSLEQSPLRDDIDPSLLGGDETLPRLIMSPMRNSHVLRSVVLLSLWRDRYTHKLSEIDPSDVLG